MFVTPPVQSEQRGGRAIRIGARRVGAIASRRAVGAQEAWAYRL